MGMYILTIIEYYDKLNSNLTCAVSIGKNESVIKDDDNLNQSNWAVLLCGVGE